MTRYVKENLNNKDFPNDIKANLSRMITLAGLDVKQFKDQIYKDFKAAKLDFVGTSEVKNIESTQAEMYVNSCLEIEGKNLSEES
jgi:hypothetical protein